MRAQRLVPMALAIMALTLGGCSRVEESEDGGIPKGNLVSLFEPTTGTVPFPFDGLFAGFTDPTLNIPSSAPPAQAANQLDGWSTKDGMLHKTFEFEDFGEAFAWMTRVALEAEKIDHHPDWCNSWNEVHVHLLTHSIDALSELDLKMARAMERLAE